MIDSLVEGALTLGPLYLVMLTPILVPLIGVGIGSLGDQIKKAFRGER